MNWFVTILQKEARYRRYNPGDSVRFLTTPRKGKGSTILMPNFSKGRVTDYDRASNRYKIETEGDQTEEHNVHPRNIMHDSLRSNPAPAPEIPEIPEPMSPEPMMSVMQEKTVT